MSYQLRFEITSMDEKTGADPHDANTRKNLPSRGYRT